MYQFEQGTTPVEFYRDALSEADEALAYPGRKESDSFMTDGQDVVVLPNSYNTFEYVADRQLKAQGLAPIADRIPVLSYGANANPYRSRGKFEAFFPDDQPAMQMVPNCQASVSGMAAVWHGKPGQTGSIFAELYNGPEVAYSRMRAHVSFLTERQLGAIHKSEGESYSLAEVPVLVGSDEKRLTAVAYVAMQSSVLIRKDRPIMVAAVERTGSLLQSFTAREAVAYILRLHAGATHSLELPLDPSQFVQDGLKMKLAERKERQAAVAQVLKTLGASRDFSFTDRAGEDVLIGRADFDSLPGRDPHLHRLPPMVFGPNVVSEPVLADKMAGLATKYPGDNQEALRARAMRLYDLSRFVSNRAHVELGKRIGEKETGLIRDHKDFVK